MKKIEKTKLKKKTFGKYLDIYCKGITFVKKKNMAEQKITIEVTESQYKHYQAVMAMDKPSRTRLTQNEKKTLIYLCKGLIKDIEFKEYTTKKHLDDINNIIKKLNK